MKKNILVKNGKVIATIAGLALFIIGLPILIAIENKGDANKTGEAVADASFTAEPLYGVGALSDTETKVYEITVVNNYNTRNVMSGVGAFSDEVIGFTYDRDGSLSEDFLISCEVDELSSESVSDNDAVSSNEASNDMLDEYDHLAIANVSDFVNIRSDASAVSDIVGVIYDDAVADIITFKTDDAGEVWYQITSGNVEGYTKACYFIAGNNAAQVAGDYITTYATCNVETLNIREEADAGSKRVSYLNANERVKVIENDGEWLKVSYGEGDEGYLCAQYVSTTEEFTYALTLEEKAAKEESDKEISERVKPVANDTTTTATTDVAENLTYINVSTPPSQLYTSNEELRSAIINYAMQYVGNRYVSGGGSLAGGTDCSGFVCYVYRDFGYSVSRIPNGQYTSNGRYVSYEEAQPGDIVCYSSNGSTCTHVGLYIGNGQIVHSANSRIGVVVSDINYCGGVLAIKNVID